MDTKTFHVWRGLSGHHFAIERFTGANRNDPTVQAYYWHNDHWELEYRPQGYDVLSGRAIWDTEVDAISLEWVWRLLRLERNYRINLVVLYSFGLSAGMKRFLDALMDEAPVLK